MSENIVDDIIRLIKHNLQEIKPKISLVAVVGSASPSKIHGDIDLFSLLGGENEDKDEIISRHNQLISILNNIQKSVKKKGIYLGVFTEFRLEEISRYMLRTEGETVLLHLKVYPYPSSINFWQSKVIAKSYVENIYSVLYEYNNGEEYLQRILHSLPKPTQRDRLEFLRSLIYETYEYIKLGLLPNDFIEIEAFNKLVYITRYLSIELIHGKNNYNITSEVSWNEINEKASNLPELLRKCIKLVTEYINKDKAPSIENMEKIFLNLHYFIEDVMEEVA